MTTSFDLQSTIQSASQKYGVPSNLISAVIKQESGGSQYNKNGSLKTSSAGAIGLMQLMPSTARGLGVNPTDPTQNVMGGTKYLSQLLKDFNGNTTLAVAAYNAGPGAVKAAGNNVPHIAETQNYVKSVMSMFGGGNVDITGGDNSSGGFTNPLDPASWLNPVQSLFTMMETSFIKFLIYVILFGLFVFFGYKALAADPPTNNVITATRNAGRAGTRTIKKIGESGGNRERANRDARIAKRKKMLKVIAEIPK
jgi:hypothetical protein